MSIRKTEGQGHTVAQVKTAALPDTNREKLNHLLARIPAPATAKGLAKSLINRANKAGTEAGSKVGGLFKRAKT